MRRVRVGGDRIDAVTSGAEDHVGSVVRLVALTGGRGRRLFRASPGGRTLAGVQDDGAVWL